MRGLKLFGVGLVAACALAVTALPVSAASAAKLLQLTEAGTPVPNGSTADVGVIIGECITFSQGKVTVNGAAKDKVNPTTSAFAECSEAGETVSGSITEAQLGSTGKATMKGTITISKVGPCVYNFTKFKGTFEVPGEAALEAPTTGKLSKAVSSKSCAKTLAQTFFADVTNEPFGEPFGTKLKT
jgi:hypothetical protein